MRGKLALIAAAAGCVLFALSPAAQAAPNGTIVEQGNFTIVDDAIHVGYSWNDPDASLTNGVVLQNWQRDAQGEPNNDWSEYKIGTVTSNWPWPSNIIENGTGRSMDSLFLGKWVVIMDFSPYNSPTNFCASEEVDHSDGTGHMVGYTCNNGALLQMFVSAGIGEYVAVRGTEDLSLNGGVGQLCAEGEFTSGGTIGVEPCLPTNNAYYPFQDYHWYNRYGT